MPAQTTLRTQLRRLERLKAIERRRRDRFPGALEYELSSPGRELLDVALMLERWLDRAPSGPLQLGDAGAKTAVKALVEAWSSAMLLALASGPLSLTELDQAVGSLSYPAIERRLTALRVAGLVESHAGDGRGTPYVLTRWAREATGPIAVATRWNLRHLPLGDRRIEPADAETLFILPAPLLSLPASAFGSCRLAIEPPRGHRPSLSGAVLTFKQGRVCASTSRLEEEAVAWAHASASGWLDALAGPDATEIEMGGDAPLALAVLEALCGVCDVGDEVNI